MTHWLKHAAALLGLGLIFTPALAQQTITPAPAFSIAELTSSQEDGWITNGGTLSNQRYSPLDQINRDNVSELKGVWRVGLDSALDFRHNNQAQPLVYEGVIYIVTGQDDVFAISVDTGEILWEYRSGLTEDDAFICCGWVSRGLGMGEGKLFLGRVDARLMALDMQTGAVLWDIQDVLPEDGYSLTAAPLYYDGMVITGYSGGDLGTRGRVKAYDVDNGAEIWTFYTIPGPGEFGHDTWPQDSDVWEWGGAPVWHTPALDPELGMLYFSTGNAGPVLGGGVRPGDNLFTASIVAIDVYTGEYRWHFQEVHHDIWDYDAPNPVILFDAEYDGVMRQGLAQAGKTGFVYILDRVTGEPLVGIEETPVPQDARQKTSPTQPVPVGDAFVPQSIRIAPEGMTLVNNGRIFTPYWDQAIPIAPGAGGGANWPPSAVDPTTGIAYVCAADRPFLFQTHEISDEEPPSGSYYTAGAFLGTAYDLGVLAAVDMHTNTLVWQQHLQDFCLSGMTATAGGLVFVGRNDGRLTALDSETGFKLWEFQTGFGMNAPVTIFERNGTQYVLAYSAGNALAGSQHGDSLWLFSLNGTLDPVPAEGNATMSVSAVMELGNNADLVAGQQLYEAACVACHGEDGKTGHGGVDLTATTDYTLIVSTILNGRNSMPAFGATYSPRQVRDVAQYVRLKIANKQ